jgi:NodT family efflux transporter outer membrane factor (OMF) lipoprotein
MTGALVCLAGCVAGPNFKKPVPPAETAYLPHPVETTVATPGVAGGEAQRLTTGADLQGDWWTLFHSKPLDDLIAEALKNNTDLKGAQAALRAAHEATQSQRSAYYPTVTAGFDANRQRTSAALAPVPSSNVSVYSLYTPQLAVSYVPDVFGLNRRTVESAKAQEDQARYQMIATDLTLTTNVANAAIQLASLEAQIDATHELIDESKQTVDILKLQMTKGYASRLDLAAQESLLAQTEATLPGLVKAAEQQRDALAVLVGRMPDARPEDKFDLDSLTLPQDLPVSLPSTLVAQRPDVLAAEANMHSLNAQIGIAAANRLPNIQLTASAGTSALALSNVFGPGAGFWALDGNITQTIFDAGGLKHKEAAAKALYEQGRQQYRGTVLVACQNVADALVALDQDAKTLKATSAATDAAKVTLDLSQRQYKSGYANYLSLLSAEQGYQQSRLNLVQAQAARYADTVALYQALGGGWWSRPEYAPTSAKDDHAH